MVSIHLKLVSGEKILLASSIEQDPILPKNALIKGIKGVNDTAHPELQVKDWSIPKRRIISYTVGSVVIRPPAPWVPGE